MDEEFVSNGPLDSSYRNVNFQIDFIAEQIIKDGALSRFLSINAIKSEHLEGNPKLIRWWFEDLSKALEIMAKIKFTLTHRLICLDKDVLLIQIGHFNTDLND